MHPTPKAKVPLLESWQQRMVSPPTRLRPPIWARTPHLQTILGHLLPSKTTSPQGELQTLTLGDGDCLRGRFHQGTLPVLIYLFHGLGGSTQADYMLRTVDLCRKRGYSVLTFNHRGCGEGRGLARHPYHSGRAEDLSDAIAFGRQRFPDHTHLVVGFSLSGNALLLLLSGMRGTVQPDGAIAINAPINLGSAAHWMRQGLNRIYESRFVMKCAKSVKQRRQDGLLTVDCKLPFWISLQEVDRRYTAPAGGFRDPQDYYDQCSTYQLLDRIRIPTVILSAMDDPFVPCVDYQQATYSPWAYCHLEPHGGHMGYLTRDPIPGFGYRWLDFALDHYLGHLTDLFAR